MKSSITPELFEHKNAQFWDMIELGETLVKDKKTSNNAHHAFYAQSWMYLMFKHDMNNLFVVQYEDARFNRVSTTLPHWEFTTSPFYGLIGTLSKDGAQSVYAMLLDRYSKATASRIKIAPAHEYAQERYQYHLSIIER